jgi:cytidine deaminase
LAGSPEGRLSVTAVEVAEGQEQAFLAIAREFSVIMAKKNYGRADIVRDESSPNMFYAVRHWASASAAEACHADAEVGALTSRLYRIAKVTHIVNGVRRSGPAREGADDRRGRGTEGDRRSGFDRRLENLGRLAGDRRTADRRLGPRRLRGRVGNIDLVAAARRARENAEARFSHFKVGAALEAADGSVITGCNVENATYGLTICAERVAMFKAISDGHRAFTRIAIVADTPSPTPPCGACRQILWEFGGDLEVVLANLTREEGRHRLKTLLPLPFDARLL